MVVLALACVGRCGGIDVISEPPFASLGKDADASAHTEMKDDGLPTIEFTEKIFRATP